MRTNTNTTRRAPRAPQATATQTPATHAELAREHQQRDELREAGRHAHAAMRPAAVNGRELPEPVAVFFDGPTTRRNTQIREWTVFIGTFGRIDTADFSTAVSRVYTISDYTRALMLAQAMANDHYIELQQSAKSV